MLESGSRNRNEDTADGIFGRHRYSSSSAHETLTDKLNWFGGLIMMRIVISIIMTVVVVAGTAGARVWNVPGDATTIASAISLAGSGDVIDVAPGVYYEWSIMLTPKSLTINGPDVVMDGIGQQWFFAAMGDGVYNYTFNGITFRNGSASRGSCLYFYESGSYVRFIYNNCVFSGNYASENGGAIYFSGGSTNGILMLSDCVFEDNQAVREGGAINVCMSETVIAERCHFTGNDAGLGGATINSYYGSVVLDNTLLENSQSLSGGDVAALEVNSGGRADIYESTLVNNDYDMTVESGGVVVADNTDFHDGSVVEAGATVILKCCSSVVGVELWGPGGESVIIDNTDCPPVHSATKSMSQIKSMFR